MITKYNTGQAVLIPATIEAARDENGTIIYDVRVEAWEGIPEDAITVDEQATANQIFTNAMRKLSRDIGERF